MFLHSYIRTGTDSMGDFIFNSKTIIKTYLLLEEWQMICWTPHTDLFKKKQKKQQLLPGQLCQM